MLFSGGSCTVDFVSYTKMVTLVTGADGAAGAMKKKPKKNIIPEGMVIKDKMQSLYVYNWFNCSGNLTQWRFAAQWNDNKNLYPELQIWRQSGNGYHKIASSIPYSITRKSATGIYIVNVDPPIQVANHDILGVFQPDKMKSSLVLYLYKHTEDYYYYCKDKINGAMNYVDDISQLKVKHEYPMVTAVVGKFLIV